MHKLCINQHEWRLDVKYAKTYANKKYVNKKICKQKKYVNKKIVCRLCSRMHSPLC